MQRTRGSTDIWTWIAGFRVQSADLYTMSQCSSFCSMPPSQDTESIIKCPCIQEDLHAEPVIWTNMHFINIFPSKTAALNKLQVPLYRLIHVYDGHQTIIHYTCSFCFNTQRQVTCLGGQKHCCTSHTNENKQKLSINLWTLSYMICTDFIIRLEKPLFMLSIRYVQMTPLLSYLCVIK